jgi:hypothetical protein
MNKEGFGLPLFLMPDDQLHHYPQYAILSGDNMTSFDKVFYFLFEEAFNGVSIIEFDDSDFWDEFYSLIHSSFKGKRVLSIPQFEGVHCEDKSKMSFQAQTFNLEVLNSEKEMGDYYEGKMFYSENTTIRDVDTDEVFDVSIDYLNDFLTGVAISKGKAPAAKEKVVSAKKEDKKNKTKEKEKEKEVIEVPENYQHFSDVFYYLFSSNRDKSEYFIELEQISDDIYDLTHEPYKGELIFDLPEFEGRHCKEGGKTKKFKAQSYTFKIKKSGKEMIDYCEGKSQYDYVTELEDCITQDKFSLVLSYFNDSMIDVGIY